MGFVVAIDGPAGSGKGSVTAALAKKFNLNSIDTGAMYRCVTLQMIRENTDLEDIEKVKDVLERINIELLKENDNLIVKLNGEDVSKEIRENPVNKAVSKVAAIKEVRAKLIEAQRKMGETQDVIMEGRDITTAVFPNADVKIYLDADLEERARRRFKQNQEKNIECTFEELLEDMRKRDEYDREFGGFKMPDDAIIVDSTHLTQDEVVEKIAKIIKHQKKTKELEPKIYKERKENAWKKFVRCIVKFVLKTLYRIAYNIKVTGEENKQKIEKGQGYIICANHLNYLDAAAIVVFSKEKVIFVGKHDLGTIPILRWLEHLFDVIPIKRNQQDMEAMKRCLRTIKNGMPLALFPEGTRKGMEKNGKAKNGAAYMAMKTGCPVLPVGISGEFKFRGKVNIKYGEPIDMTKYKENCKDKAQEKEMQEQATKEIMDAIIMLTK